MHLFGLFEMIDFRIVERRKIDMVPLFPKRKERSKKIVIFVFSPDK